MRRSLIIDDHDDIRENIAEILTLARYEVFTAPNGKRGVETALKEKPELRCWGGSNPYYQPSFPME